MTSTLIFLFECVKNFKEGCKDENLGIEIWQREGERKIEKKI